MPHGNLSHVLQTHKPMRFCASRHHRAPFPLVVLIGFTLGNVPSSHRDVHEGPAIINYFLKSKIFVSFNRRASGGFENPSLAEQVSPHGFKQSHLCELRLCSFTSLIVCGFS